MSLNVKTMNPIVSGTQQQTRYTQPAQPQIPSDLESSSQVGATPAGARYGLPFPPPPAWFEAQAAWHERVLREGVITTDQIRFISPTKEEQQEFMRQKQADAARLASSHYAANSPSVPDNHDTVVPNIAGLSLKWASVVRDVVQDLVKHPGPGTLYGGYGDKTTSSATELLGWIDDYIAKLSSNPQNP